MVDELSKEFDKDKIIECLFDPVTSEILAELETDGKDSAFLAGKLKISEDELSDKLSYLIEHDFVKEKDTANKKTYYADADKLNKILENDKNFDNVIDGITEMDSYLN